jgi:cyclopropane-fatty-acyl-phospholipid synthase
MDTINDDFPHNAPPEPSRGSRRSGGPRTPRQPPADWGQRIFNLLSSVLREGRLEIRADDGSVWTLGRSEPHAVMRVRDAGVLPRILLYPALRFGETYMDGDWEPEGRLLDVLEVGMKFLQQIEANPVVQMVRSGAGRFLESNDPQRSRRNISRHYNLDADFFRSFLDADLHYSCAYFAEPEMTLEQAQQAKCAYVAAKLDLKPGARVLDIGCGWGGMAMYLAERYGAEVTGVTLSDEQCMVARKRSRERGLQDRIEFRVEDYRQVSGCYDAIVSIGMFEHVGRPQYQAYFNKICELLTEDGTALMHTIGRSAPPGGTNPWINKYIFPGGYIPAASEVLLPIERSGLLLTDLEVLRLHYARTLAFWHERFHQQRSGIASQMGERFCRMWEFYLQVSEASFRWDDLVVFQFQLSRKLGRLPIRRDYLYRDA